MKSCNMSCNYADGLSPYENKGILGIPESFDSKEILEIKCKELSCFLKESKHVVIHSGAGISTSAGIPDFRGPKGVWTLQERGEKPSFNVSFNDAKPTRTHMAIRALVEAGYVQYIVSQNIDGLHLKSGLSRKYLSELHGNMFIEKCQKCRREFVRRTAVETVGQKSLKGLSCRAAIVGSRSCRSGVLQDTVLDWEHDLPERDLDMAIMHSSMADLNITMGTTLQIVPSGNLPLKNKRNGGKLVICNLQPTKHDKKSDLIISSYTDDILAKVCKRLGVEIPDYLETDDPTSPNSKSSVVEWTLTQEHVKVFEEKFKRHRKASKTEGCQNEFVPKKKLKSNEND